MLIDFCPSNAYRFIVTTKKHTAVQTYPWPLKSLSGEKKKKDFFKPVNPTTKSTSSVDIFIQNLHSPLDYLSLLWDPITRHTVLFGWWNTSVKAQLHHHTTYSASVWADYSHGANDSSSTLKDRKMTQTISRSFSRTQEPYLDHYLNLPLYPAAPLVHGRPLAQSLQAAPVKCNHTYLHIGGWRLI